MSERLVLVVSGGSRGIGRAVVLAAATAGYDVAFTYSSAHDQAKAVAADAAALGAKALALQADVSSRDAVAAAFETVGRRFGRLNALVNNAGVIGRPRSILELDADDVARVFATNVLGAFYCTAEATALMSRRRGGPGGAVVNISSAAARHGGLPHEAPYASSKGALDSMTVALAKELPEHGIRINAVRPGLIRTDIHEAHGGEAALAAHGATVPIGRAGAPDEVAAAVIFLLGAGASYVNGAILDVGGGR